MFIFITFITLIFLLYKYSTENFNYWKKRNVPYVEPLPFIGNCLDIFTFRSTLGESLAKFYNQFKTRYFGIYILNKPYLVLKDPELIRSVLITDFNYFSDRNVVSDEECDPITSQMLFFIRNPEWRRLRTKVTPVFSAAKIKNMTALINEVADEMRVYVEKNWHNDSIEAKELFAKYATDVLATTAYGIKAHCFQREDAEFRIVGRRMFEFNLRNVISQTCYFMAPSIVKLFKLPFFDQNVLSFSREVVWETLNERIRTNSKRNDIIDVIKQIKIESTPDDEVKFEGDRVVAQAALFFAAGFETVSATMSFALYEMCIHQEIQAKVREEIKRVLSQYNEITYDALKELTYLEMVILETLRKYPVLPFLDRLCSKDYKVPESDLMIEKGTSIFIPLSGLHMDAQYYPYPDKFDPERFSENNKGNIPNCCHIPFGDGPRVCIGIRFAMTEMKTGLISVLSDFKVKRSANTPVPLDFEKKSFLIASKVGLPMKFRKTSD